MSEFAKHVQHCKQLVADSKKLVAETRRAYIKAADSRDFRAPAIYNSHVEAIRTHRLMKQKLAAAEHAEKYAGVLQRSNDEKTG